MELSVGSWRMQPYEKDGMYSVFGNAMTRIDTVIFQLSAMHASKRRIDCGCACARYHDMKRVAGTLTMFCAAR